MLRQVCARVLMGCMFCVGSDARDVTHASLLSHAVAVAVVAAVAAQAAALLSCASEDALRPA